MKLCRRRTQPWLVMASALCLYLSSAPFVGAEGSSEPPTKPPPTPTQPRPFDADEEGRSKLKAMSLEELLRIKITVASRLLEEVADAPSTVTVFTHDEIRAMGVSRVEDLLNFVAGINLTPDVEQNRLSAIAVRGLRDSLSKNVLVLLDGQVLNDAFSGGPLTFNRELAVTSVEQVEIVRGPGSALYGSGALLAVVSITTKRDANDVTVSYSTNSRKSLGLNLSRSLGDLSVSAYASVFADDGHEYRNIQDASGVIKGSLKDPSRGFDARLSLKYRKFSLDLRHADRSARGFITYALAANDNAVTYQKTSAQFRYEGSLFGDRLGLKTGASINVDDAYVRALVVRAGTELIPGVPLDSSIWSGPIFQMPTARGFLDTTARIGSKNRLVTGVSYEYSWVTQRYDCPTHNSLTLEYIEDPCLYLDQPGRWGSTDITRRIASLYAQDDHQFTDNVNLIGGMRLDQYSDAGLSFAPRAALVIHGGKALPGSTLKLMYGRSFRVPNFFNNSTQNNPVDFGNPDLKPEKADTFEAGYTQKVGRFFEATVTGFRIHVYDLIVLGSRRPEVPENPLRARTYDNLASETSKGLEFEAKVEPFRGWILKGNYTRLLGELKGGRFPRGSGSFVLDAPIAALRFNLQGIYRQRIEQLSFSDSYTIFNASLSYAPIKGMITRATLDNLTDKRYNSDTFQQLPAGLPNRGRELKLSLILDF